jgi:FkbM family methyltransferase
MNALYNRLNMRQQEVLFHAFHQIFVQGTVAPADAGEWEIRFVGKQIRLPLRSEQMRLDWDLALATIGHDNEVKQTYAELLRSSNRPDLFVDIGGNFGTHSLIFLSHGIQTITFEPNPVCHGYFEQSCSLTHVIPRLEKVALGESPGSVELFFPEGEAWLGTTDATEMEQLGKVRILVSTPVEQRTLDNYFPEISKVSRILIKIDTEGSESAVLRGARRTLELGPLILMEMLPDPAKRAEMLDVLADAGYGVARLPWRADRRPPLLRRDDVLRSTETNFLAVPRYSSAWFPNA